MYSPKNSKIKPFNKPIKAEVENVEANKEKDIGESENTVTVTVKQMPGEESVVVIEEKEYLLGKYLGQYVVYTSATQAWLLS